MREELLYIKNLVEKVCKSHKFNLDSKSEQFIVNFLKERFKIYSEDEFLADEFSKIYRKNVKELELALNDAIMTYIAKQRIEGHKIVRYG
jgi:transposase